VLEALKVLTVVLVATTMALALAHALELPREDAAPEGGVSGGPDDLLPRLHHRRRRRGSRRAAGDACPGACDARGTTAFWLTLGAFVALLATHLLSWLLT
jgi:hypothetical protein